MTGSASRTLWIVAAVVLAGGSLAHFCFGFSSFDQSGNAWGTDDAYISIRYAAHLHAGEGLVFQSGDRVEGYTNLLWVLLLAPFCGGDPSMLPYVVAACLGLLATLWGWFVFVRAARARFGDGTAACLGLLLALTPQLWLRAASGLESSLVFALQLQIWLLVDASATARARPAWLVLLLAALILLRADGFVAAGIVVGYLILRRDRALAPTAALVTAITTAALFLGRHAYYGEWLPNTYFAKVALSLPQRLAGGSAQFVDVVVDEGLLPGVVALLVAGALALRRRRMSLRVFLSLASIGYWLYVGGDNMRGRFLLLLFPLGLWQLALWWRHRERRRMLTLCALLVLAANLLHPLFTDKRFDYRWPKYDRWVALGRHLGEHHAGQTLAIDAAGKVPYFSQLHTLDMLGLNEWHIARMPARSELIGHSKYDPHYVLEAGPDLIATWVGSRGEQIDFSLGLAESLYAPAGYALRYLVNRGKDPREQGDILDVRGWSRERIHAAIADQYRYGVLERSGSSE